MKLETKRCPGCYRAIIRRRETACSTECARNVVDRIRLPAGHYEAVSAMREQRLEVAARYVKELLAFCARLKERKDKHRYKARTFHYSIVISEETISDAKSPSYKAIRDAYVRGLEKTACDTRLPQAGATQADHRKIRR